MVVADAGRHAEVAVLRAAHAGHLVARPVADVLQLALRTSRALSDFRLVQVL